jgi:GNAT superfamily N-acetyltransferase
VRSLYIDYVRDEVLGPVGYPTDEEALGKEAPPADLAPPTGVLLLVSIDGVPVAIGGVRDLDTEVAEVKSMCVAPAGRGRGLGGRLLERLEGIAAEHGCRAVRLDTAAHLTAALALYRSRGYHEIPDYNTGPIADHWFERRLGSSQFPGLSTGKCERAGVAGTGTVQAARTPAGRRASAARSGCGAGTSRPWQR